MFNNEILEKFHPDKFAYIWNDVQKEFQEKNIARPIIAIHGGYGKKNVGDDALCGVFIDLIKKHIPHAHIVVICHSPEEIKKIYPEIVESHYFASLGTLLTALRADLYIIGGGGIINIINTYSGLSRLRIFDMKGKFMFMIALLTKLTGAKLFIYGIGATSIPDIGIKILARKALNICDFVSVRDHLSAENLKKIGVRRDLPVSLDPAVFFEPSSKERAGEILQNENIPTNKKLIGFVFRHVNNPLINNEKIVTESAKIADRFIETYKTNVLFIPFGRHPKKAIENDIHFAQDLDRHLKHKESYFILKNDYRPNEYKALIGKMQFCLLERLHAVIFAQDMNIPYIAVCYDNKVEQFIDIVDTTNTKIALKDFSEEKIMQMVSKQHHTFLERSD